MHHIKSSPGLQHSGTFTHHIIQCLDAGADVATCPLAAIKGLLKHPLTDSGLAQFLADHARVNG